MAKIKPTVTSPALGTIYIILSAICFAIGGVLIKILPLSSFTINGMRSVFACGTMLIYMRLIGHSLKFNKTIFWGAVFTFLMSTSFVISNKLTTAANTIILQFTHPIFLIILLFIIYRKKPDKSSILTCLVVFIGIIFFFFDKLNAGGMVGNILALVSGFFYAIVFILKKAENADFESSMIIAYLLAFVTSIPSIASEPVWNAKIWILLVIMGIVQSGFSFIFLSRGLDVVNPVTAALTSGIEPVLNPILVALIYGEMIGPMSLIGGIIVIGSVLIYSLSQLKNSN